MGAEEWITELQVMRMCTMHDDENANRAVAGLFSWIRSNRWRIRRSRRRKKRKEKKRKEKAGVGIPRGKPTGGESSCCGKSQESAQKNKGAINHEVYCPLIPLCAPWVGEWATKVSKRRRADLSINDHQPTALSLPFHLHRRSLKVSEMYNRAGKGVRVAPWNSFKV